MSDLSGQLLIHNGDDDLLRMLTEHGIIMDKPNPPLDVTLANVSDNGVAWIVVRFWKHGDEGLVGYGISETASEEENKVVRKMVWDMLSSMANSSGHDWSKSAVFLPVNPISHN